MNRFLSRTLFSALLPPILEHSSGVISPHHEVKRFHFQSKYIQTAFQKLYANMLSFITG